MAGSEVENELRLRLELLVLSQNHAKNLYYIDVHYGVMCSIFESRYLPLPEVENNNYQCS